ncbi:DNA adenine methylase [Terrabacter sp. Soil811]|uniref:DNA adenine methylase n=1 Tax=Terrabacter sp. Soil811 TaxID=1736419 RepID=UPI000AAD37D3|nr:Dam family site-specific DNA-(adenine-N6)-methyltransferase [Terrabacter sp. Soil811]
MANPLPPSSRQPLRPFLKWAGGKGRLLARILPYVPDRIENYHEPFLGGGAMFFALRDRIGGTAHLHDLNHKLITAWQMVQQDPVAVRQAMKYFSANDSKEFYLSQRQASPATLAAQAAWFIYVNQTSWNGLWRVNRQGQFNVPWGDRPFRGIDEETLHRVSDALIGATITTDDFRLTLDKPQPGDFVYLDPPYIRISLTSKFDFYHEKRFRTSDLEELAALCHNLTHRGVHWVMSNRDTQQVRDLFPANEIVRFTARRSLAAQNRRDVEATESPEALVLGSPS